MHVNKPNCLCNKRSRESEKPTHTNLPLSFSLSLRLPAGNSSWQFVSLSVVCLSLSLLSLAFGKLSATFELCTKYLWQPLLAGVAQPPFVALSMLWLPFRDCFMRMTPQTARLAWPGLVKSLATVARVEFGLAANCFLVLHIIMRCMPQSARHKWPHSLHVPGISPDAPSPSPLSWQTRCGHRVHLAS